MPERQGWIWANRLYCANAKGARSIANYAINVRVFGQFVTIVAKFTAHFLGNSL
jgi:hypothetical protein